MYEALDASFYADWGWLATIFCITLAAPYLIVYGSGLSSYLPTFSLFIIVPCITFHLMIYTLKSSPILGKTTLDYVRDSNLDEKKLGPGGRTNLQLRLCLRVEQIDSEKGVRKNQKNVARFGVRTVRENAMTVRLGIVALCAALLDYVLSTCF